MVILNTEKWHNVMLINGKLKSEIRWLNLNEIMSEVSTTIGTDSTIMKSLKIGLYYPLDSITNPKYKVLHFLTTKKMQRDEGTSF
jgi:hypothetical protein